MPIHHIKVSSRDPFSTVLHDKASVFRGPFFYGVACVSCMACVDGVARTYMSACILYGLCILYDLCILYGLCIA